MSDGERRGAPVVVIGYGNTLREDDGLGPQVAALLEGRWPTSRVAVFSVPTLTPELSAELRWAERVVFVDAATDLPALQIGESAVFPLPKGVDLVHFLDPAALLTWTQRLFDACPDAVLIAVGAQSVGLSEELTPEMRSLLPEIVARVTAWVERDPNVELPRPRAGLA